jgi:hypothetical protein
MVKESGQMYIVPDYLDGRQAEQTGKYMPPADG